MSKTKSEIVAADIAALFRARTPITWVSTREEARVERYLIEAAVSAAYVPRTWDVAQGIANLSGRKDRLPGADTGEDKDPGFAMTVIGDRSQRKGDSAERGVWIMRDLPVWLNGPPGAAPLRQLRNLARSLPGAPRESAQAIIILTPSTDVPAELSGHATVVNWPLPDREEIAAVLDAAIDVLPEDIKANAAPNGQRDAAVDAAVGLSGEEAASCYAKSLVQTRRVDPVMVAQEKKRVIARERVLEWFDPLPDGLNAVGGLENLKAWLLARRCAYSPEARAYGLPAPKGLLLVGISGCGKSLTAKAISTAYRMPLLRLDLGALKDKFVGGSEGNLRKALEVIKTVGRCVVWLDEVEKALAGATQGAADGGVSADALGTILSWMQERQGEAFVVATANDVSALPPEFLRKGRFDEIFFVDLPNETEREAVLAASLRQFKRDGVKIDGGAVAQACQGFTGSEIAAIVPDALFTAFADKGREITTVDLIGAASQVVPLSKTASEKIEKLREWAKGRARPATAVEVVEAPKKRVRVLDI